MKLLYKGIKYANFMVGLVGVLSLAAVVGVTYRSTTHIFGFTLSEVTFSVSPGELYVGFPASIDLGSVVTDSVPTDLIREAQGDDKFYIYDFKSSSSGYYVTLQSTPLVGKDLLDNTVGTIPATNFYIQTTTDTALLETGTANPNVKINSGFNSNYVALDTAQTYFYRDPGVTSGAVGIYYNLPIFKVVVPAFQTIAEAGYSSFLIITLIDLG